MDWPVQSLLLHPIEKNSQIFGEGVQTLNPKYRVELLEATENWMKQDYAMILQRNDWFIWQEMPRSYQ